MTNKLIQQKLQEFRKLSSTFVGQRGWVCQVDNEEGYGIWPSEYKTVEEWLSQSLLQAKQEGAKEEKLRIKHLLLLVDDFETLKQMIKDEFSLSPEQTPEELPKVKKKLINIKKFEKLAKKIETPEEKDKKEEVVDPHYC